MAASCCCHRKSCHRWRRQRVHRRRKLKITNNNNNNNLNKVKCKIRSQSFCECTNSSNSSNNSSNNSSSSSSSSSGSSSNSSDAGDDGAGGNDGNCNCKCKCIQFSYMSKEVPAAAATTTTTKETTNMTALILTMQIAAQQIRSKCRNRRRTRLETTTTTTTTAARTKTTTTTTTAFARGIINYYRCIMMLMLMMLSPQRVTSTATATATTTTTPQTRLSPTVHAIKMYKQQQQQRKLHNNNNNTIINKTTTTTTTTNSTTTAMIMLLLLTAIKSYAIVGVLLLLVNNMLSCCVFTQAMAASLPATSMAPPPPPAPAPPSLHPSTAAIMADVDALLNNETFVKRNRSVSGNKLRSLSFIDGAAQPMLHLLASNVVADSVVNGIDMRADIDADGVGDGDGDGDGMDDGGQQQYLERRRGVNAPPIFDFGMPRNITGRTGQTETLIKCRVDNLNDKSVSWIRKRDLHILTVGTATYTTDKRFEVTESRDARDWTLHVKSPQPRDSGIYECQVNTEPKMSMAFQLNVIEISPDAKAVISGPRDLHFKSGSAIILNCVVQQPRGQRDIGPIYWYRGEHMITPFDTDDTNDERADRDDGASAAAAATVTTMTPQSPSSHQQLHEQSNNIDNDINAGATPHSGSGVGGGGGGGGGGGVGSDITPEFASRIAMESQLGDTLKSRLRIANAQTTDTGNYTCQPTTASSASVMVHVINDEKPAAMQKSNGAAGALRPFWSCECRLLKAFALSVAASHTTHADDRTQPALATASAAGNDNAMFTIVQRPRLINLYAGAADIIIIILPICDVGAVVVAAVIVAVFGTLAV